MEQGSAPTRKAPGAAKSGKADAPWVATGAAVDAQYTEARSEARDHMRLRNTFFQQVALNQQALLDHANRCRLPSATVHMNYQQLAYVIALPGERHHA